MEAARPGPGDWYMVPRSVLPLPSFLKGSFAHPTGTIRITRTEIPQWLVTDLTDRAAKRGKGQQPILVGAIYRGKHAHAAFKAGGNDRVQLKVAQRGVATSSEKYTVAHSAHTQVRFIAVTWDTIPTATDLRSDDSDDLDYRSSAKNWRPPHEHSDQKHFQYPLRVFPF